MPIKPERGNLKIFLGFAAGVGKTYQMLEEGRQLKAEGIDVVIGYFEPHARKETIALTDGLETVPRRMAEYRGTLFEDMDTDAILARRPEVCLVDEFPHTNVPGSARSKRWEDVLVLLDAGIDVYTTMNIQHLESLNDQVQQISGVRVRETIPDWVMERANEVVMVDLAPRALLNRLERGVIYKPDKAKQAMSNFFRESTLAALREMALRQTAHEVGSRRQDAGSEKHGSPTLDNNNDVPRDASKRILVLVTDDPSSVALIRRAKRVADFIHSDCMAVGIAPSGDQAARTRALTDKHLNFARNLHVETRLIEAQSVPETLVQFARANSVTEIFIGWPKLKNWLPPFLRNDVQKIVRLSKGMQVTVVDDRRDTAAARPAPERDI